MKITFIGATHEVTGSCYYLEAAGKKFLVDYGMEQGPDYYENQDLPIAPGDLDFVLLTHAHMDHSGNLPALYAKGYQGPIYATEATCNLCDIMLRDSAHIQMFEAEWRNRKGRREGKPEYPSIHITAAISNISFNLPVRKLINLGFMVLAMNAGLDSGILDPTNRDMLGLIYATEALLGEDDYCMEYIGAYREGLIGPVKK